MALVLLSQTSRTRSPHALVPRNVDGTSLPDQRWASADLSPGFSIQIQAWPVHQTRPTSRCWAPASVSSRWYEQGPSEAPASPLLPFRLEARLPNSVESPFLSFESIADSTCRQLLLRSLASKTSTPPERLFPHTQPFYDTFVSCFEATLSTPRDPTVLHTQLFSRSLRSLASTHELPLNRLPFSKLPNPSCSRGPCWLSLVRSFDTRGRLEKEKKNVQKYINDLA